MTYYAVLSESGELIAVANQTELQLIYDEGNFGFVCKLESVEQMKVLLDSMKYVVANMNSMKVCSDDDEPIELKWSEICDEVKTRIAAIPKKSEIMRRLQAGAVTFGERLKELGGKAGIAFGQLVTEINKRIDEARED